MARVRSPNFPAVPLGSALVMAKKAFDKENRNKMSRATLGLHLGHKTLSGPATIKIGALRSYGLVDGSGDELRVSDDAVTAVMAPADSRERKEAMRRLALNSELFKEIHKEFPDTLPSEDNLRYWLVKRQFTAKAAQIAAKAYLSTMRLVESGKEPYDEGSDEDLEDLGPMQTDLSGNTRQEPGGAGTVVTRKEIKDDFSVLLKGNRLQISATVDADGIARLKQVLDKYEEILKLLQ
ncbi:MAG: hypothetical protein QOF41_1985 [Methylobacteriaceae bacterium]|nr:hypothetical protein [Methylobacteriaceae bacterium]